MATIESVTGATVALCVLFLLTGTAVVVLIYFSYGLMIYFLRRVWHTAFHISPGQWTSARSCFPPAHCNLKIVRLAKSGGKDQGSAVNIPTNRQTFVTTPFYHRDGSRTFPPA
jgi:hypothetical protein